MSEKIEINTLITKHENKYKNCRFDMIDVEDPLWEYGSPLKRVLIDNQTGETYDEVGKLVGLLNELETKCHKLERELEESSAFIIEQREENKQLRLELETHKHSLWSIREAERKVSKLSDSLADEIKKNGVLNEEVNQLRIENMRLKKKGGDGV